MNDFDNIPLMNNGHIPNTPPQRADAVANRKRLLETAVSLFAELGVEDVHMERIAQEAGVGKGTLYRHFPSKGDLCLTLLEGAFTTFQNEMLAEMRQGVAAKVSPLDQLAQFLAGYAQFVERHMPFICEIQRGGVDTLKSPGPYAWLRMTIEGLLQSAVATDELSHDLDIPFLADMLLAPLTAQFFRFLRERRGFEHERISAGLQTLVYGLASTEPT